MDPIYAIRQWLYIKRFEIAAHIEHLRRKRIRVRRRDSQAWFLRCCAFAVVAGIAHFYGRILAVVLHALQFAMQ